MRVSCISHTAWAWGSMHRLPQASSLPWHADLGVGAGDQTADIGPLRAGHFAQTTPQKLVRRSSHRTEASSVVLLPTRPCRRNGSRDHRSNAHFLRAVERAQCHRDLAAALLVTRPCRPTDHLQRDIAGRRTCRQAVGRGRPSSVPPTDARRAAGCPSPLATIGRTAACEAAQAMGRPTDELQVTVRTLLEWARARLPSSPATAPIVPLCSNDRTRARTVRPVLAAP